MRLLLALALTCLCVSVDAQSKEAMGEREVKKLVEEYVTPTTTEKRRNEIGDALNGLSPLLAQKSIKAAIPDDTKRPYAIDLALLLKVPGLFDSAKKYIDTEDEDKIVRLGLSTKDKNAAIFLVDRWSTSEVDSASFGYVNSALKTNAIPLEAIQKFRAVLKDKNSPEERRTAAVEIVAFQFGTSSQTTESLTEQWDELEKTYKVDGKQFPISGVDLLTEKTTTFTGPAVQVGDNYRLSGTSKISIPADSKWENTDFTITMHLRVISGEDCSSILQVGPNYWQVKFKNGEWVVPIGSAGEFSVKGSAGEWATVAYQITQTKDAQARKARTLRITINDKEALASGQCGGDFKSFTIYANTASIVVGGVDLNQK